MFVAVIIVSADVRKPQIPLKSWSQDKFSESEHDKILVDNEIQCDIISTQSRWMELSQRAILCNRRSVSRGELWNMDAKLETDKAVATGRWEPIVGKSVSPGLIVKVQEECMTGDEKRIMLYAGDVGVIKNIDEDGDAHILFPGLSHVQNRHRWVLKSCFPKMRIAEAT